MEINKEFYDLVTKLVNLNRDELSREQLQRMDKIMQDSASRGWSSPTGHVYGEFDDLQMESIRRRGDIVWSALEQTLKAFDPSFNSDLAAQLHSLAESFFPLSLCEPQDYLRGMGWKRPLADEVNQQLRNQLEMVRHSSLSTVKTKIDLYVAKKRSKSIGGERPLLNSALPKKWDLFICHASEDKQDFVKPLAEALRKKKIDVWYDEFCIEWGDSIRQKIEEGLKSSKFGIVVFSHAFFRKKWPQNELDALYQRMIAGEAKILPILHGIDEADLRSYAPLFSGISAKESDHGVEYLSTEIEARVREIP